MTHGPVSAFTWAVPGWALASLAWGAAFRSRRQLLEPARLRTELAEACDRARLVVLAYESRGHNRSLLRRASGWLSITVTISRAFVALGSGGSVD